LKENLFSQFQIIDGNINWNDYDVVLLDIHLPGRSGLEVLGDMKHMKPGIPVLIINMYPEEQYAIRGLKSGASGYLTKESAPDELLAAIRKVLDGKRYITQALAEAEHLKRWA